ncbi:MAG: peptidylprolyl isomerase [Candidatus Faecousia sp.]|nr:peptidylprolyl isomerase [Clostridiales bacterium]MDY6179474.1 peptidylprolyl isomerase [Candidatus Faecousia sp.]
MSASSKKKLRNSQDGSKLTERQMAEQKEAKKLKLYTAAFVVVLAVLVVVALAVGINQAVANSGIRERKTVAMTVGDETVSSAEMSYFFSDYCRNYYSQNSTFLQYLMDPSSPLDSQVYNPETGETWADFLLEMAQDNVRSIYALSAAAEAAGHTLSEDEEASVENTISTMRLYAQLYGFSDLESYLKAMYGKGSTEESYREYCLRSALAGSYYTAYSESLTYDDAALREAEKDNFDTYSSFTYNSYYLSTSRFLEGGTTDENGTTTYSDEERAAASAAAEAAVKTLTDPETITSPEALDEAIAALSINQGSETSVASTIYEDKLYTSIDSDVAAWLAGSRKEGDLTAIAKTSVSTDDSGAEVTTVSGYYVVWFVSRNDNKAPLDNVRHILVGFEGGTTDSNGSTTYSDEEKAAARTEAESILAQWKAGDKTEDSFAALATEKTDDTASAETGGLYEDISPASNYVTAFKEWALDDSRKPGDTGIVETEYGYHVMYYCGESALTYRDSMIKNDLVNADMEAWYEALLEAWPVTPGETKYLPMDMTLGY